MKIKNKKSAKIKYTGFVASSIDGRISENSLSNISWTSKEDWNFFQKSIAKMDAVIVGHNTYKVAKNNLRKRNTIVLTSTVKDKKIVGKIFFLNYKKYKKDNLEEFFESKNYKNIAVLGGSKVYDFCLSNDMLDEIFITIEPYIFTAGVPMFSGDVFKKCQFSLQSIKKLNKNGTILLKYKNEN